MHSIKKWFRLLLIDGKKSSLFLSILVLAFSGVGYLFINQFNDTYYFNKKINFNHYVIKTFYDNNNGKYLVQAGKEAEAEKHQIFITPEQVKKYIENMPQFQNNGHFDKTLYDNFLKSHKISQYDMWTYAAQQVKTQIFDGMISGFPMKNFQEIENLVTSSNAKVLSGVSGDQYFIKDAYVQKLVDEKMSKVTKKELKEFIQNKTQELSFLFVKPETRKGFLIDIQGKTAKDFTQADLDWFINSHLTSQNAQNAIKQRFNLDTKIIIFEHSEKTTGIVDLLFEPIGFYERGTSVLIPIVDEVIPVQAKTLTNDDLEKIKEEYRLVIFKQCASLYSLEISNMFNNGLMSEKELAAMSVKKAFFKDYNGYIEGDIRFFTIDIGKSITFQNYEGKSAVFICKKRNFKKADKSIFAQFKKMGQDITPQVIQSTMDSIYTYWIYKFERS